MQKSVLHVQTCFVLLIRSIDFVAVLIAHAVAVYDFIFRL